MSTPAPDFTLPDATGKTHSLDDYHGQWLVLYFYPKDDTPGCTTEACAFRDNYARLQEAGLAVVGVSRDTVESHQKFAQKYDLQFPLLSDENADTIKAYGAWGKRMVRGEEREGIKRNTYVIDPEGNIRKSYESVDPATHTDQILSDIEELKQG
ncbi:MAG TPA: peroxiredoxin [Thermomicrobiaceae bacterium]|nr:peroxiredoxin [Thermomicrobiaceae bacterium]